MHASDGEPKGKGCTEFISPLQITASVNSGHDGLIIEGLFATSAGLTVMTTGLAAELQEGVLRENLLWGDRSIDRSATEIRVAPQAMGSLQWLHGGGEGIVKESVGRGSLGRLSAG